MMKALRRFSSVNGSIVSLITVAERSVVNRNQLIWIEFFNWAETRQATPKSKLGEALTNRIPNPCTIESV